MTIISNALKNVVRNKGRNILMIIIVTIITAAATVGLAILQAAQHARDTALDNTTITAQISRDRNAMMAKAREGVSSSDGKPDMQQMREAMAGKNLTLADYKKYDTSSYGVESSYYTETSSLAATDGGIEAVDSSSSTDADKNADKEDTTISDNPMADGAMRGGPEGMGMDIERQTMISTADFSLVGFSSDEAVQHASNGSFTMDDGSVFGYGKDHADEVIISKTLADYNDLAVGDTITVANPGNDDTTYTLKVVGIYSNTADDAQPMGGPMASSANDSANAIYTSVSTLEALGLSSDDTMSVTDRNGEERDSQAAQLNYTYVFADKAKYEQFVKDVKANGLSDEYTVSSRDIEAYEASLVPINNLSDFARMMLIIVLCVGAVVLVILTIFNIRERKYEIGVLTAIGMNKWKVTAQFAIELLTVTLIGLALGTGIGAAVSAPVSNSLLHSQVEASESQQQSQRRQFGRDMQAPDMPGNNDTAAGSEEMKAQEPQDKPEGQPGGMWNRASSYVSTINASVNWATIAWMLLIGLALTLLAALVAAVFVMRYEPLQILADRS